MRYVYVVTRICEGDSLGTPIPNLGVHTSFKKAKRHFDAIVDSRIKHDAQVMWGGNYDTITHPFDRYVVVNKAIIYEGDFKEELRLEKWKV
jgi:hypothetical protein